MLGLARGLYLWLGALTQRIGIKLLKKTKMMVTLTLSFSKEDKEGMF